jgi:hypothetical protein
MLSHEEHFVDWQVPGQPQGVNAQWRTKAHLSAYNNKGSSRSLYGTTHVCDTRVSDVVTGMHSGTPCGQYIIQARF